ncbi:hypothetical protein M878_00375 [Streptomyces roseochromogenus subsp. oscitans DS 12.976]|uniref:Malonyl-CoA:ACP transacylase (MAT) domain-containing protein n=1 Tax=Streptomyces roseochromogenus subsp. oscitans DS 12.976 TaxID=1352936 RepID=V6KX54_STRRC|nr:hypothetical protein M878_00375 [Streptomyces roseochromogenus subsp. oscitans DS 12.976]
MSLAVVNSPSSSVLAGDLNTLRAIEAELTERGVFCRPVSVDVASHSRDVDLLRPELTAALGEIRPGPPAVGMLCTVCCAPLTGPELDACCWMDNLRRPVRFAESAAAMAAVGDHVSLEISPHPVLTAAIEETLTVAGATARTAASLRRHQSEAARMARAASRLFTHGARLD